MITIRHREIGNKRTQRFTRARNKSFRSSSKAQLKLELLEELE